MRIAALECSYKADIAYANHMSGRFLQNESIRQPQRGRESKHEEHGRERGGVVECPMCHNVHFKKKWYATLSQISGAKGHEEEFAIAREQICPACMMIKNHLYEGELIVERVPDNLREDLMNLISNYGDDAKEKDPQDRIIEVQVTADGCRVITTENQLVDRMAKKIRDAFKKVDVQFSHSREPFEVDRVHVVFNEK